MVDWAFLTQVDGLGNTDCEALGGGFLAQPVNATTSLAYVAAGLTLIVRVWREDGASRTGDMLFGTTLIAVGFGSMAFHGPQPTGSQFYHDVPIAAALLYIFLSNLGRLDRLNRVYRSFLVWILPLAGVHALFPTFGQMIATGLAAGAIFSQIAVYRYDPNPKARQLELGAAALLAIAGTGYFFGRTDSGFCDPGSLWQVHGLWHVLSAAAFMIWGLAASARDRGTVDANV